MQFAVDLVAVALAAVIVSRAVSGPSVDPRIAHLSTTAVTGAVLAGVAAVALAGARAQQYGRSVWIAAALGFYAVVCLPLGAIGPRSLHESPGPLVALIVGQVVVAIMLLVAHWVPAGRARRGPWITAAAAVVIAAAAGAVAGSPAAVTLLDTPGVRTAVALGWIAAAACALVAGVLERNRVVWRIGLGLAVLAAAQLHEAVVRADFAAPSLVAAALQLVGAIGVLWASVRRLRGEVSGLLTERDLQRAELREAVQHVERAAALARERDHELANGLAGLAGIAYLLDQPIERSDGDGAALRSAVLAEIARLHALLKQAPQRPHPGVGPFASLDLVAVLDELVALRRGAGEDVELIVERPLWACADRDAVVQVVTNLLVNCARHAPGSRVRVYAHRDGGRIAVEVHDDGPGAPPGSEDTLIDEGVTGAETGGTGLGLAVSRRLLAAQGGELRVLPMTGRGFRVRCTLPEESSMRPGGARNVAGRMAS